MSRLTPHIHAFDIDIARLNPIVRREREQSHRKHAVLTRGLREKEVG
jgi:hypothetical protein